MTLSQFNTTNSYSTDAAFQTDCLAIHNAILAVGLVQTADAGQISFPSLTRSVANNSSGYIIYAFADALQATYPVYIKIEYGAGTVNYTQLGLWVTVGFATNGAGVITGNSQTSRIALPSATTNVLTPGGVSGSTSRLTASIMLFNGSPAFISMWFSVERLQSTAGADTSQGIVLAYAQHGSASTPISGSQVVYYSGYQPPPTTALGSLMPNQPAGTTWVVGANTGTGPILPLGFGAHPCIQGGLLYFQGDISAQSIPSISVYGTPHNYLALGSAPSSLTNFNASAGILARWD